MHLGEIIKEYRFEHGKMSMQTFADKCGLSKGYIAMLERNVNSKTGEPVIPSLETFMKVAHAMNMTLDELLSAVDENQPVSLMKLEREYLSEPSNDTPVELDQSPKISGVSIPIVGTIVAGMPVDAYEDILGCAK